MRFEYFLGALALCGCNSKLPAHGPVMLHESFERPNGSDIGPNWYSTAPNGVYRLEAGSVVVQGAHNHPLWLTQKLPRDAVIELDAWSDSSDGDIKVEVYGDGRSHATGLEYTSTGYVLIHGGWRNQITALCRQDEHGGDRKTRRDLKVVPGKHYHYTIARHGGLLEWFIDGKLALDLKDTQPLEESGHEHMGLDDWETRVHYDEVEIRKY